MREDEAAVSPPRYRLGDVIGRGGMGEVVSAVDEQIGRTVAVKRMHPSQDPQVRARFLREARIQGRLEHPAVVPVHELITNDAGEPYIVMKQLAGITLQAVIAKLASDPATADEFPRQRLLRAFSEVCLAVEFAHTHGVIHRDLKPANLMLGDFGEVYVLDWGVARVSSETDGELFQDVDHGAVGETVAGSIIGTPGYLSPEQAHGDAIDGRADVYSLGCVLFEILALQPLHRGVATVLERDDVLPSKRAPENDVPPELDEICARATSYEAADRYPSARALGAAVQAFLDGDRDGLLRKRLAAAELAAAKAALARGDDAAERRHAMRAAGRALALEPTSQEPAELIARLMLTPPTDVPPEVARELDSREISALASARRLIWAAALSSIALLPLLVWAGVRDAAVVTMLAASFVIIGGLAAFAPLTWTLVVGRVTLLGWMFVIAVLSYGTSPFVLPPPLVVIIGMAYATQRALVHPAALLAGLILSVLVPWALHPDIFVVTDNRLEIDAPWLQFTDGTLVALSLNLAIVIATAVLVARTLIDDRRSLQLRFEIQSWQLRQLVPEAAS